MKSDEQTDEWKYTIFKTKLPKSEPLHLIGWEQNGDHSSVYFFCLFCCCVIIFNTHAPLSGVLVIVSTDPKTGCEEYFCTFLKQKSYSNTNNFTLQDIGYMVNEMISDKITLFISKVKKIRLLIWNWWTLDFMC